MINLSIWSYYVDEVEENGKKSDMKSSSKDILKGFNKIAGKLL